MKPQRLTTTQLMFILIIMVLPVIGSAQDWGKMNKLVASDRKENARFGFSVSISGDYAIVGASLESNNASDTDPHYAAGAAYIFMRAGDNWLQQQKIVASDRNEGELFGYSVCISGDYAIVGAVYDHYDTLQSDSLFRAGSAYIFKRSGSTWTQQQKLVASDRREYDNFGISVSISGGYAIVGAWQQDLDSSFRSQVPDAGAAYIFMETDTGWIQQEKLTAADRGMGDEFGISVSISGDYAIVGADGEDQNPDYGDSLDAGAAYIFTRVDTIWTQTQKLVASERNPSDRFGWAVAISGIHAVVGSPNHPFDTSHTVTPLAGAAYIFKNDSESWIQQQKIFDTTRYRDLHFGYSVSLSGNYLIAGTEGANLAFIFEKDGDIWDLRKKLVTPYNIGSGDFGFSVAVSGDYSIVGAYSESYDTSGNNPLSDAGQAYIYGRFSGTDVKQTDFGKIPCEFHLGQNYPNPFNPTTKVSFVISHSSLVTLIVYDVLGREVATLVNEKLNPEQYEVIFDGSKLPSGVYFYRLQTEQYTNTKKFILLK